MDKIGDIWGSTIYVKTHFMFIMPQNTCFNWNSYTCSYAKWVRDMFQYNKLSEFQNTGFHILVVYLYFRLVWSASIPNVILKSMKY